MGARWASTTVRRSAWSVGDKHSARRSSADGVRALLRAASGGGRARSHGSRRVAAGARRAGGSQDRRTKRGRMWGRGKPESAVTGSGSARRGQHRTDRCEGGALIKHRAQQAEGGGGDTERSNANCGRTERAAWTGVKLRRSRNVRVRSVRLPVREQQIVLEGSVRRTHSAEEWRTGADAT